MMMKTEKLRSTAKLRSLMVCLLAVVALIGAACGGSTDDTAAEPVAEVVATEVPAEPTPVPEPTEVPPTATPVPEPTATEVPPTATPVPEPTATEVPPTAEPEPEPAAEPEPAESEPAAEEAPAEESEPEPEAAEEPAAAVPVIDGGAIYQSNCSGCHGASGEGGRARAIAGVGPLLASNPDALVNLVTNGGTNMPSFGTKLSADEIDAVVAWVIANI